MKPNFALSLSFDGLRLMHRVQGGWHLVGQVGLDDPDLTGALAGLKDAASALEPNGISTKLLVPNDQIKYIALDGTRAEDEDVRAALHGATPYSVDELAYDFAKGGGRTYVAAVAHETLQEAKNFASEHGFNPVCFAAVPEPFTFVGEAFFGATEGQTAHRDDEPVIVIGDASVDIAPTDVPPEENVEAAPKADVPQPDAAPVEAPLEATDIQAEAEPDAQDAPLQDTTPEPDPVTAPEETPQVATDQTPTDETGESPAAPDAAPDDPPAPMCATRLRADRSDGAPEPKPKDDSARTEPTFSRKAQPLAVPTGAGTDAMPPLSAPSRDADAAPTAKITIDKMELDTAEADVAPPVTGDAPTALPPEAAVAAATLTVEPDPVEDDAPEPEATETKGAAAAALGAATAVGGAVGGMFASRRMARADAKAKSADAQGDAKTGKAEEKSRLTVFGARKQPKPKPVVGGKPRFLGLILTAILLLFLLAFAAFAALSEDGIAGWFGFGSSDETQIASDQTADPSADPIADPAAPEVAALAPPAATDTANAPDALATPTAPSGGQVLSPEEATRIYAATGVWQRAPRIPLTPRTSDIDALTLGMGPSPVPRVPPSPLASSSSVAGDALIATPIDPPAPDATFNFGADGLIVASETGNLTPDGILIIAGTPPLNPPTRPGTIAPEVTPQDQLAAVVPDTAQPVTDAPDGVIIISGRPVIEPPVRTGTAPVASALAPTPEDEALTSGTPPLVATDGLLVLAGSPPILPPARPGTVAAPIAPTIAPVVPEQPAEALPELGDPALEGETPEGLNIIAGPPPILPPSRPGTRAPQIDTSVTDLSSDVAAALALDPAQTPTADTRRPLIRPAAVIEAAVAAANAPVLGELTSSQAASFRPRTRPAGLAPAPVPDPTPDPEPDPVEAAVQTPAQTGLQIAPEIAAAVQAAANRPNPIVNPTRLAVPVSSRPDPRPRNMDRIVARAQQAAARAATQVAAVAPRTVAPSGPTGSAVAQNATLDNAINLRDVNLIGIYGGSNDRRALVRLANGRYVRVTVGDRLDGGRVTGISAGALNYTKRGRAVTLEVAG